jgi:hypothetical protein
VVQAVEHAVRTMPSGRATDHGTAGVGSFPLNAQMPATAMTPPARNAVMTGRWGSCPPPRCAASPWRVTPIPAAAVATAPMRNSATARAGTGRAALPTTRTAKSGTAARKE